MSSSPPLAETAAREVRAELARQRKSASSLAQHLGKSDMYVSRRLSGGIPFDLAELAQVAAFLSVPVSQFLPPPVPAHAG